MKRSELFGMVWKEPLASLAPKLGMSKPTLLKLCRLHNVPVPGRGHWAKVKAGQIVEPDQLSDGDDLEIEVGQTPAAPLPGEAGPISCAVGNDGQRRERQTNDVEFTARRQSAVETLLMLGLKERQAAATSAHLVQLLLVSEVLEPSVAMSVRGWVSKQL